MTVPWKTNSGLGKIGSRFSFSGHWPFNRSPVFADQKVIICVLCFTVYYLFLSNTVIFRPEEKKCVLLAINVVMRALTLQALITAFHST